MEEQKQLRILCFHGYRQSAEIFQRKSGALRKALKSRAKFEFISAPFTINNLNGEEEEEGEKKEGRAWWFSNREQRSFSSREVCTIADGFEESIKYTLELVNVEITGPEKK